LKGRDGVIVIPKSSRKRIVRKSVDSERIGHEEIGVILPWALVTMSIRSLSGRIELIEGALVTCVVALPLLQVHQQLGRELIRSPVCRFYNPRMFLAITPNGRLGTEVAVRMPEIDIVGTAAMALLITGAVFAGFVHQWA
jgi:hypothetical protein